MDPFLEEVLLSITVLFLSFPFDVSGGHKSLEEMEKPND